MQTTGNTLELQDTADACDCAITPKNVLLTLLQPAQADMDTRL